MSVDVVIEIDFDAIERTVKALQEAGTDCGITVQHLVWEIAADAAMDCIRYTPPLDIQNIGDQTVFGGFGKQRKTGEGAVAVDLNSLFAVTDGPDTATWTKDGRHWVRRGRVAFDATEHWTPDAGGVAATHLANRGGNGRIRNVSKQYWTKGRVLKKRVREVKKNVGELKAGWLPALQKFAALTNKSASVPKWIARHSTPCLISDSVTAAGDGAVVISNGAHHRAKIDPNMIALVNRKRQTDADKFLAIRAEKIAKRIAGVG